MAKLKEEVIVIKISKLFKDKEEAVLDVSPDLITNLETIVQEMVGPGTLIESEVIQGE
tara:strand:- start:566 stop:739 length:174 start_codon:yes stop_codon:yes gene_type:complete